MLLNPVRTATVLRPLLCSDTTAAIPNVYLPRRTEVALAGGEAGERSPSTALSKVVSLAGIRANKGE